MDNFNKDANLDTHKLIELMNTHVKDDRYEWRREQDDEYKQQISDKILELTKAILNQNTINMEQRTLTNGEFKVGIGFNPGKHEAVEEIKRRAADLIDAVERLGQAHTKEIVALETFTPSDVYNADFRRYKEVGRLTALSVTHIEDAAMWGVKAVTK